MTARTYYAGKGRGWVVPGKSPGWISGFCNKGNPADSHARCKGASPKGSACICECHAPADDGPPLGTLRILPDLEQRSDEWYDQRRGMLTASAIGGLLTSTLKVADNETSRALTATLAAERITGWTDETPTTPDMWRGIEMEPYARDAYAEHHAPVVEVGFMVRETDAWTLGYSPDGLVGDVGLIEIKCPRSKTHLRTILADAVPGHYMAQCQAALLVSGRRWVDFVSYVSGMPLWVKRVMPDPAWQDALIAAAEQFEINAAEMVADYRTSVDGLAMTERVSLEIVI